MILPGAGGRLVSRVLLSARAPTASFEVLVDARTGRVLQPYFKRIEGFEP